MQSDLNNDFMSYAQTINKHEDSALHFNEMSYQNKIEKIARLSRNALMHSKHVTNVGNLRRGFDG